MSDLKEAPAFKDLASKINSVIKNKIVIIYNAEYDERLIMNTCEQDEIKYLSFRSHCAMIHYSKYKGKWSDYHYSYTFQRLPGGDHSAVGDCLATLKVIHTMANSALHHSEDQIESWSRPVKKWWEFWK